jgi:hypothetical protein
LTALVLCRMIGTQDWLFLWTIGMVGVLVVHIRAAATCALRVSISWGYWLTWWSGSRWRIEKDSMLECVMCRCRTDQPGSFGCRHPNHFLDLQIEKFCVGPVLGVRATGGLIGGDKPMIPWIRRDTHCRIMTQGWWPEYEIFHEIRPNGSKECRMSKYNELPTSEFWPSLIWLDMMPVRIMIQKWNPVIDPVFDEKPCRTNNTRVISFQIVIWLHHNIWILRLTFIFNINASSRGIMMWLKWFPSFPTARFTLASTMPIQEASQFTR